MLSLATKRNNKKTRSLEFEFTVDCVFDRYYFLGAGTKSGMSNQENRWDWGGMLDGCNCSSWDRVYSAACV